VDAADPEKRRRLSGVMAMTVADSRVGTSVMREGVRQTVIGMSRARASWSTTTRERPGLRGPTDRGQAAQIRWCWTEYRQAGRNAPAPVLPGIRGGMG
jgi:hypothetical protein